MAAAVREADAANELGGREQCDRDDRISIVLRHCCDGGIIVRRRLPSLD